MKLELKHLAPYLPYGIKLIAHGDVCNVAYMSTKRIAFIEINGCGDVRKCRWDLINGKIKPILKPLVDLLETVEHRDDYIAGWKFIEMQLGGYNCGAYEEYMSIFIDDICPSRAIQAPYEIFALLLEYHFDVFGLIDQGLAIDVNDLPAST